MRRRDVIISLAGAAVASASRAQERRKVYRIGFWDLQKGIHRTHFILLFFLGCGSSVLTKVKT